MILVMYFILALLITTGMRALERKLSFGRDYGGVQM
jgi:ABC-type amino acid transport system permease subunit